MPPSEEGGGCLHKGFEQADGRRDTQNLCESSRYRRELIYNDIYIILCAPTPLCKWQPRVISPSVAPLNPFWRASFAPSPLAARASAVRSRTCGRQRLAFLAASATGGARKPNPSEGAEAAAAASRRIAKVRAAVKPAEAGCPHPSRRCAPPSPKRQNHPV